MQWLGTNTLVPVVADGWRVVDAHVDGGTDEKFDVCPSGLMPWPLIGIPNQRVMDETIQLESRKQAEGRRGSYHCMIDDD